MSDNAIIGIIMGGFAVLTWLLGLSYFLGRNTAKLDGLADAQEKLGQTIRQIFDKLDDLSKAVPHQCQQLQAVAELQAQIRLNTARLSEIEVWRHAWESSAGKPERMTGKGIL